MSRKSTKKASKNRTVGKRGLKDLTARSATSAKGGGTATGKSGGNVAGGWDLISNKVHS